MKKSLFRPTDILELSIAYIFCFFLNLLFDYGKTLDLDSYLLEAFLKNYMDYRTLIVLVFTSIAIVFHYQMLRRKKAEIFCRILVGATVFHITIRYIRDCLRILIPVYFLSVFANFYMNFNLASSFYLVLILIAYILISARQVRKYENF